MAGDLEVSCSDGSYLRRSTPRTSPASRSAPGPKSSCADRRGDLVSEVVNDLDVDADLISVFLLACWTQHGPRNKSWVTRWDAYGVLWIALGSRSHPAAVVVELAPAFVLPGRCCVDSTFEQSQSSGAGKRIAGG